MLNWWLPNCYQLLSYQYDFFFFYNLSSHFVIYKKIFFTFMGLVFLISKKNFRSFYLMFFFTLNNNFIFFFKLNINVGLINALSFWHPALLYISLLYYFFWFLKNNNNVFIVLLCVVFFVILGSWWSSQELMWLGWWNWDGVENTLLIYAFLTFFITHVLNKKIFFLTNRCLFFFFILFFFLYLNKTNIFKSVHSFTNSSINNISYVFSVYFIIYLILLILFSFPPFWLFYFFLIFFPFLYFYVFKNINVFYNLKFFYFINFLFTYFIFFFNLHILNLYIILTFMNVNISFHFFLILYSNLLFPKKIKILHSTIPLLLLFLLILSYQTINYFLINVTLFKDNLNFKILNKGSNITYNSINTVKIVCYDFLNLNVYKNITNKTPFLMFDKVTNLHCYEKNYKYNFFYVNVLLLFLVIKVFYLKQKPRYNYYIQCINTNLTC